MTSSWVWLLTLCCLIVIAKSWPTGLFDDEKKANEMTMRPKTKRAQEMLLFDSQQNHQTENNAANSFTSTAEKRTVTSSGLGGLKAALAENDKPSQWKTSGSNLYDFNAYPPHDKNYEYSKVLVNELSDELPQVWNGPPYARYYLNEDRRKRSEKLTIATGSTTLRPSTASFQSPAPTQQSAQVQAKRSVPIYQEPRFKRELDIDPEDILTILTLWENERGNRNVDRNWRKYSSEEYENIDDEDNLLDEQDPRNVMPWMDSSVYPARHYGMDSLSSADIGIVRTHPPRYYKQYGNQYAQQNGGIPQYGEPQYGLVLPQQTYYNAPEKRFMVSRKRSQGYDPYSSSAQLQLGSQSRGHPYQHRLVY